jgi:hypothetical protein
MTELPPSPNYPNGAIPQYFVTPVAAALPALSSSDINGLWHKRLYARAYYRCMRFFFNKTNRIAVL